MDTELKLSKQIPARRKTVKFKWVTPFQEAGKLNKARANMKMTLFPSCWWCKKKFANDEITYLAQPEKGRNRLLCAGCASALESGERE